MKPRSLKFVLSVSLVALSAAAISGCSKLETGAHAEPSVSIKLNDAASPASDKVGTAEATGTEAPVASGGIGTFSGQVVFKGNIPAKKILIAAGKAEKDKEVCSASGDIPDESLLVSKDGGIANVFVYLDKAPAGYKSVPPTEPVKFDQKNCVFTTHALLCQVGQPVTVLNSDGIVHNTHTFPGSNSQFNSGVPAYENKTGVPLVYKKAEKTPFLVKCDFHSWMVAFHLPLSHPFAAVTDADGKFQIKDLPAGTYQFRVWHEKADQGKGGAFLESKLKVTVKPGDNNEPLIIPADAAKFGL